MSRKYQHLSKKELIRRLEAMEQARQADQNQQLILHDLHVHQEEVRAQNEQLTEAKKSLKQSRDRYADLYDFAPIAYITFDGEGLVREINLTGARLLNIERGRVVDTPFVVFVHPEDRFLFLAHMRRCREDKEREVHTELRLVARKGAPFSAHLLSHCAGETDQGPLIYRTAVTDLSEIKRVEEEKRELILKEQSARAAAEAKDEFLAIVSHELRTPLTAILLWAKLLRGGQVSENQQEVALGAIEHSAVAQQQLIEDLLDISRLVSGRLRLEIRDTDIVPVIASAVDTVRPAAELKRVYLESFYNPDIGQVRVDPDRIRQVVWNLLHNAVKFTPAGGRVTLRLYRMDEKLGIEVVDTGQGIPRAFLPHIFERFRQADASSTRKHGGLGLGLAITRQLVELHGGTIHAESRGEGKGATFYVELPAAAQKSNPAIAGGALIATGKESSDAAPVLRGARILLVEDDAQTRSALVWLLQQRGAQVSGVDSVTAASSEFGRTVRRSGNAPPPFDLIISDIGMPGQDGYDLIRQVRLLEQAAGVQSPIPALALTAYARETHRKQAISAGYTHHVAKPVDPSALVETIVQMLQNKNQQAAKDGSKTSAGTNQAN